MDRADSDWSRILPLINGKEAWSLYWLGVAIAVFPFWERPLEARELILARVRSRERLRAFSETFGEHS